MEARDDKTLFDWMQRELYSAVICDSLDELGYRSQAMNERIRPLEEGNASLAGRAKTILSVDVYHIQDNPYVKEIASIDSILPDEVVVAATNQSVRNGMWGELLSTASKMRGARGAIIDGLVRDTAKIVELGFPLHCAGYKPVDSRGRGLVIDYDCPVEAGGVLVHPGDVVFADRDGVVVIPQAVLVETIALASKKANSEHHTRRELLEGKLLRDVYEKYGVL
ncbi:RraA family protein [Paenibacillus sacheonensis]|uniref:Putative 4-hydroxy-4-methyl-2-oxoglutarate aldolase n=1 Tax=Paenibacillus sacheonensis TaxID=742054 RepID=A0A7X4YRP2_9BACL|nr:RraA family protein [Paenibacillus sacheonensis]MBM7567582.1 regulator of RNase E activity RraA [Paenibacillus sacheonensis]NBC71315.1 RraA family protein [Paenibacillus sacheonensis]